jgi:hypothetical protein
MQNYLALESRVHEVSIITDDYRLSYEVSNEISKAFFLPVSKMSMPIRGKLLKSSFM